GRGRAATERRGKTAEPGTETGFARSRPAEAGLVGHEWGSVGGDRLSGTHPPNPSRPVVGQVVRASATITRLPLAAWQGGSDAVRPSWHLRPAGLPCLPRHDELRQHSLA